MHTPFIVLIDRWHRIATIGVRNSMVALPQSHPFFINNATINHNESARVLLKELDILFGNKLRSMTASVYKPCDVVCLKQP